MSTPPSKFDRTPEESRPYNTTHQKVSLTSISLQMKTVIGHVELTLVPKRQKLRVVKLNAKQCKIYKIMLNDTYEIPEFVYYDLTMDISDQENATYSLDSFAADHKKAVAEGDPDASGGELIIRLPEEASHLIAEGRPFRISMEYSIEDPQGGLYFFVPEDPNGPEKAHMFSTRYENSSRLWFPCIDTYSEVCPWRLDFTVDESLTAVSCGDLVDIIQAADGSRRKTYHYYLSVPTAAPNIGVAVGPFETYIDPNMHEIVHFCLPGLLHLLRWTSRFLHEVFEFYEESLDARFPYGSFKHVYCNHVYEDLTSFSSMSILDTNLLHTSAIIDQTYVTRRFLALSIAEQFYSCYISCQQTSDAWLSKGISNYLSGLYLKKFFGNNDYRYWIHSELQEVLKYEQQHGGVILDPSMLGNGSASKSLALGSNSNSSSNLRPPPPQIGESTHHFMLENPQTVSPKYLEIYAKKAHLVVRMLEHRIGSQLLLQVLNKQLSLASIYISQTHQAGKGMMALPTPASATTNASGPGSNPSNPMLISTSSFTRAIFTVTGKDMTVFMDQWVRQGGHVRFHMSFVFNRKRNTVELELKQECLQQLGVRKYVGPLTVALQELDGTFKHVLQIENTHSKADIVCHSKSRRQKKKKIPLCTGEEVDMDLTAMDTDSPVLWIRLDPDMTLIRAVDTRQPDFQWQYQLRHERDITAQLEAIWALEAHLTQQTRQALSDVITNEQAYYKVRCQACYCLAKVANAMVSNWTGPTALLETFRKLFGSFSCPQIVKHNDFSNLQHYFLQKTIPVAVATLRNSHGICPADVLKFLLDLFKYNDNSKNQLSDNYYRAALVSALGNTVTPVVAYAHAGSDVTAESLSTDTRSILDEITRCLNLEKMLHSYKFTVTVECLRALRKLQKFGHIPNNINIFKGYTAPHQFYDVRLAALEALVDYTKTDGALRDAEYLLDIIENDPLPRMRYDLCQLVIGTLTEKQGERRKTKSPFQHRTIAVRLWDAFSRRFSTDAKIRCALVDLYFTLFGTRKPLCLLNDDRGDEMEIASRRKSPLTTREGVEDYRREMPDMIEAEPPQMVAAKVLSSKRESMASDNSGELPETMDTSLPTSFEPGMFKDRETEESRKGSREREKEKSRDRDREKSKDKEDQPPTKKHHHHHSKNKKKKEKKKKHKHKHKHRHHEHKKPKREETLSSGSSASNSPSQL